MNEGFIIEGETIFIPYNINNILIKENDIITILKNNDVHIENINHIEYFHEAFIHKSYCKKTIYPNHILDAAKKEINNINLLELRTNSYERLEYLGDSIIKAAVRTYLIERYMDQDEGFLTRLQTKIEDKYNLAMMSKKLGLEKYFIISKQIEMLNGRNLNKIHEDIFEAFIGALYKSNGYEFCLLLIVNLLETLIDWSEKLYCDNNYKDYLLRIFHQKKWNEPIYTTIKTDGLPHQRKYIMGINNPNENNTYLGYGLGNTKKEGEQKASKMALIILGYLNKDQYTSDDIYYPNKVNTYEISEKSI